MVGTACGLGSPVHQGLCKMSSELLYMETKGYMRGLVAVVLG
jgi:hypothetical protein